MAAAVPLTLGIERRIPAGRAVTPPQPAYEAALERIAFGCLWALILAIPWEGKTTIGGFAISRWMGLLSVVVAALRLAVRGRMRRLSPLHYLMAVFVAWAGLSFLWTAAPDMTISRIGSYVQLLVLVWLIWELAPDEQRWMALARAFSFGAGVAAIDTIRTLLGWGGAAAIDYEQWAADGRYAPEGFDQNELALVLALSLPVTIYLITRRQSKILEALCWLELVLCGVAILLTGSRAGLMCLLTASTMICFALPHLPRWKKTVCVAVIACAVTIAVFAVPATTWQRLSTIESEITEGTLNHRTLIWAAGATVFRSHPFIGVGAGAFGPSVEPLLDINYYAHNSFLSVLVELGVVGELILLALLAGMLHVAFRMPSPQKWLWIIMLATWALGVFSLTWEYRKPTWFLFGMLAAQAGMARISRTRRAPCRTTQTRRHVSFARTQIL